jgi:hypothetical protein
MQQNFILIVYVLSLSTDVKLTIIRYLELVFNLQTRYKRIFMVIVDDKSK